MEKIKELLQQSLNIDFIAATLSNPRRERRAKKSEGKTDFEKGSVAVSV